MDWISSSSDSSSDSDDSEIEEILFDDDIEHKIMSHLVEQFETGARGRGKARRSGVFAFPGTELSGVRCS